MNLYVIRHGEIEPNFNRIIASYTDVSLNENGIKQANKALEEIKKIDYDVVICSPMKRTTETANIINYKNIEIIFDDRIVERNAGIFENKKAIEVDLDLYWNYFNGDSVDNVEKISKLFKRVNKFLEDIKIRYKDKNVLVVTHDGVCRTIACQFRGIPESGNIREYAHKNCEIRKYELN